MTGCSPTRADRAGSETLWLLTVFRGIAAAGVFAFHLGAGFFPGNANAVGYAGVTFFFVLSGFVLTWSSRTRSPVEFYIRRASRIFPLHLLILTTLLIVSPGLASPLPIVVVNGFLLQSWFTDFDVVYSLNGVTWSLSCELFFYLLFPFVLRGLRRLPLWLRWLLVIVAFVGCSVLVLYASGQAHSSEVFVLASVNPLIRVPEFLVGVLLAQTLRKGWRPGWILCGGTVFASVGGVLVFPEKPALDVWATPLCAVLIYGVAYFQSNGPSVPGRRLLVPVGEVSFAFYMVHQLVIVVFFSVVGRSWLAALLALGVSSLLALLLHRFFEVPVQRKLLEVWREKPRGRSSRV